MGGDSFSSAGHGVQKPHMSSRDNYLADNLTEVAGSLSNVQYSGDTETWAPDDDMYADIFNSMTEDMDDDDLEDGTASENSIDVA